MNEKLVLIHLKSNRNFALNNDKFGVFASRGDGVLFDKIVELLLTKRIKNADYGDRSSIIDASTAWSAIFRFFCFDQNCNDDDSDCEHNRRYCARDVMLLLGEGGLTIEKIRSGEAGANFHARDIGDLRLDLTGEQFIDLVREKNPPVFEIESIVHH